MGELSCQKLNQSQTNNLVVSFISKNLNNFKGCSWLLTLFIWLCLLIPAQAAVEVRVALKKNLSQVQVGSSSNALIRDRSGKILGEIAGMNAFTAKSNGGGIALEQWRSGELWLEPKDNGYVWIGDRWYRGRTRLVRLGNGVTAINHVNVEDYLYSVVGAEAIPSWPLEALKAQAVSARTYAMYKRSKATNHSYDLDSTTNTQVYKGLDSEYVSTHQSVQETLGQVLTYNGQAILAVFHSSSGGHTENVEDVWSSKLPYLRGVTDYDQVSPVYQWTKTFTATQIGSLIGGVGSVRAMIPERTTPQGRVVTMKVVGDRGTKRVSGDQIRNALDLRSTLFNASSSGGSVQINGKGFGHGVGLSQWGAYGLAEQGINYQQILGHYYQNASLSQFASR